jgi:NADH dehydrogenase
MGKGAVALGVMAAGAAIAVARRARHARRLTPTDGDAPGRRRVVIVGAGWGGLYTALELEKHLRPGEGVDVTLISRENSFLCSPLLPEVAASAVSTHDIVNPIRLMLNGTRFVNGEVTGISLEAREVQVQLFGGSTHTFTYNHLVLAVGAATNFFGLPGMEDNSINVKELSDAVRLRNQVIDRLEQADVVTDDNERRRLVTFVQCGGGLNGVEVVGALSDYVRAAVRAYPHVPPADVRVILIEAAKRLMPEMEESLAEFTRKTLESRGVEVWLNARAAGAEPGVVVLADGRKVPCGTIIWSAGVRPAGLVNGLPLERDRWNRVICDGAMRVKDHPGVWAVGDVAHIPRPGGAENDIYPSTAQHALREAYRLGKNIVATLRGEEPTQFDYHFKATMAAIGHRVGVASIMGHQIRGIVPWWIWRTYYLARLPRIERRLRVTIDWTLDMFFPRDIVRLPLEREAEHFA